MEAKRIPFEQADERRIASAASWGMVAAGTTMVSSVISLATRLAVGRIDDAATEIVSVLASFALGILLMLACVAFRKVAVTDEADQRFLMQGFRRLLNYFQLLSLIFILSLVALGIMVIIEMA